LWLMTYGGGPSGGYIIDYSVRPRVVSRWHERFGQDTVITPLPTTRRLLFTNRHEDTPEGHVHEFTVAQVEAMNLEELDYAYATEWYVRFANTLLKNVLLPDRTGVRRRVDGEGGEHKKYFLASHGWLVLSGGNPQVYHDMRTTYENRGDDDFRWLAHLLKWERKLGGPATMPAL
ncbi:MAG: hypothetical protein ACKOCX_00475, partial [Planctomycetota bacterium]